MQASRSLRRTAEAPRPTLRFGWLAVAVIIVVLLFVAIFLPASVLRVFVPQTINLEEPSGTVWHGSVARVSQRGMDLGSVEWRLHPGALFRGALAAEVRWVRRSSTVNSHVEAGKNSVTLRDVQGSAELADWADLGIARGWNGQANLSAAEIRLENHVLQTVRATLSVAHLSNPQKEDLGGYEAHFDSSQPASGGSAQGTVRDLGGPLEMQGNITLSASPALATIAGNLRERSGVPSDVHALIEDYAALRPRDTSGFVPFEFELAL